MASGSWAQLGRIRIGAEPLKATIASRRVRKRVYPPPRARKLTCGSACPRFGSNTIGKLARVERIALCCAAESGAATLGMPCRGLLADRLRLVPAIAHNVGRSKA